MNAEKSKSVNVYRHRTGVEPTSAFFQNEVTDLLSRIIVNKINAEKLDSVSNY